MLGLSAALLLAFGGSFITALVPRSVNSRVVPFDGGPTDGVIVFATDGMAYSYVTADNSVIFAAETAMPADSQGWTKVINPMMYWNWPQDLPSGSVRSRGRNEKLWPAWDLSTQGVATTVVNGTMYIGPEAPYVPAETCFPAHLSEVPSRPTTSSNPSSTSAYPSLTRSHASKTTDAYPSSKSATYSPLPTGAPVVSSGCLYPMVPATTYPFDHFAFDYRPWPRQLVNGAVWSHDPQLPYDLNEVTRIPIGCGPKKYNWPVTADDQYHWVSNVLGYGVPHTVLLRELLTTSAVWDLYSTSTQLVTIPLPADHAKTTTINAKTITTNGRTIATDGTIGILHSTTGPARTWVEWLAPTGKTTAVWPSPCPSFLLTPLPSTFPLTVTTHGQVFTHLDNHDDLDFDNMYSKQLAVPHKDREQRYWYQVTDEKYDLDFAGAVWRALPEYSEAPPNVDYVAYGSKHFTHATDTLTDTSTTILHGSTTLVTTTRVTLQAKTKEYLGRAYADRTYDQPVLFTTAAAPQQRAVPLTQASEMATPTNVVVKGFGKASRFETVIVKSLTVVKDGTATGIGSGDARQTD